MVFERDGQRQQFTHRNSPGCFNSITRALLSHHEALLAEDKKGCFMLLMPVPLHQGPGIGFANVLLLRELPNAQALLPIPMMFRTHWSPETTQAYARNQDDSGCDDLDQIPRRGFNLMLLRSHRWECSSNIRKQEHEAPHSAVRADRESRKKVCFEM